MSNAIKQPLPVKSHLVGSQETLWVFEKGCFLDLAAPRNTIPVPTTDAILYKVARSEGWPKCTSPAGSCGNGAEPAEPQPPEENLTVGEEEVVPQWMQQQLFWPLHVHDTLE